MPSCKVSRGTLSSVARMLSALVVVVIAALQGLLNNLLRDILEIKVGFKGNTTSRIAAAVGLSRVAVRPLPDRSPQVLAAADPLPCVFRIMQTKSIWAASPSYARVPESCAPL